SHALRRVGAVKSTGPDPERMLTTLQLLGPDNTWVVTGYPPFLRTLLDAAAARGLDLSAYRMYGFVGGEGMSEALRARLEPTVRVHGANIYPEDVEWALGECADADQVLGFALDLGEDIPGVVRPLVHVECRDPGTPGLADRLATAVRDRLLATNADFRTAVA